MAVLGVRLRMEVECRLVILGALDQVIADIVSLGGMVWEVDL